MSDLNERVVVAARETLASVKQVMEKVSKLVEEIEAERCSPEQLLNLTRLLHGLGSFVHNETTELDM